MGSPHRGDLRLAAFHPTPPRVQFWRLEPRCPPPGDPEDWPQHLPLFLRKSSGAKSPPSVRVGGGWVRAPGCGSQSVCGTHGAGAGSACREEGGPEAAARGDWRSLRAARRRGRRSRAFCLRTGAGLTVRSRREPKRSTFRRVFLDTSGPTEQLIGRDKGKDFWKPSVPFVLCIRRLE